MTEFVVTTLADEIGDNTLTDAVGNDNFFGRGGANTFVLVADGSADNIKDFEAGADLVDLSAWQVTAIDALDVREHASGKLILLHQDETLSIQAATGPLTRADLTPDSFIFADAAAAPPQLRIEGTDQRDRLLGTALNEEFVDGAGIDNLFGRGGADTFILVNDNVADHIRDFEIGVDQIDLTAWGVTSFSELTFGIRDTQKLVVHFEGEVLTVQSSDGPLARDSLTEVDFILG